jgi:putative photosynthetic complex assembly protein
MSNASLQLQPANTYMARLPLIGMVTLVVLSFAIIVFARLTGLGVTGIPASRVISSISLTFEDREDGSVIVRDDAGRILETIAVSADGFIRGAMRSMARDRKRLGLGSAVPFVLERRENGRLGLSDPSTGGRLELDAFGPSNSGAFARFLPLSGSRS